MYQLRLGLSLAVLWVVVALLAPYAVWGQCIEGNCVNGEGVKITRGHKYEGEFKDNHRHGFGKYTFPDGSVYVGQWNMGDMEGEGEYRFPNGDIYKGGFRHNLRNGQGTYYYAGGSMVEGVWENNVLIMEGPGLVTDSLSLEQKDLPPAGAAGDDALQDRGSDLSNVPEDNGSLGEPSVDHDPGDPYLDVQPDSDAPASGHVE